MSARSVNGLIATAAVAGFVSLFSSVTVVGPAWSAAGDTEVVSVSRIGHSAGGAHTSGPPSVSANGRFVYFGKGYRNVYLRDRGAGTTEVVSVTYSGDEPDNLTFNESLSGDARYATFTSYASNMVLGDSNGEPDAFLRDRHAVLTERISVNSRGVEGNGPSFASVVSDAGRIVVFTSYATNLAPSVDGSPRVFVRDRVLGTTQRLVTNPPWPLSGEAGAVAMSADGRYVAFDADGPGPLAERNVFLHDRVAGTTQRVSMPVHGGVLAASGGGASPAISANGRYVAFSSAGNDFGPVDTDNDSDVYVWDRVTGVITRESYGYAPWVRGLAYWPSLSGDGRFVSFFSGSWNLIKGQTIRNSRGNIYTRDRATGALELDSATYDGSAADGSSIYPMINRSGRWVVFKSYAGNLVENDNNGVADIFVHDRGVP